MKKKILNESHYADTIIQFVKKAKGLNFYRDKIKEIGICQLIDGKCLNFKESDVEEVLHRKDSKGESFIQVNFYGDKKIILTDRFIGFKPFPVQGLDMTKLPKVVTTPDLLNFIEVIEDSMYEMDVSAMEVRDIRRYFEAVLLGAEKIGFHLIYERIWVERLFLNHPAIVSQVA